MAGIINKIGDALHIGGNKDENKNDHKKPEGSYAVDHKKPEGDYNHKPEGDYKHQPEKKEGIVDKIKDKIHGDGGSKVDGEGEKKKKKKDKKKKDGHHDGGSSSSSDSD